MLWNSYFLLDRETFNHLIDFEIYSVVVCQYHSYIFFYYNSFSSKYTVKSNMHFCAFIFYSTIKVPPHSIWVPFPHAPSLPKKTYPRSDTSISHTTLSTKSSPMISPLIPPFTESYFSGTLSTSPTANSPSETSATSISESSVSSTSVTTTLSSSESLAPPTTPTFLSIASNKSDAISAPSTKSVTNVAFSIKYDATYLSKPTTIDSPSVGLIKHSAVSSSEPPPKPSIALSYLETTTKPVAQIHTGTDSTQPISGNKKVTTAPILPLTPFTITLTPTVSPINHFVSAAHPHSTADGHGSLPNGSPGKYDN